MTTPATLGPLDGPYLTAADAGWDAARLFHSGIGVPDAIVQAACEHDVVAAVRHAEAQGLDIAVRGGGHSAWGTVPGGLLIDLARLDDVSVEGDLVRIGGGATWGAVAEILGAHGLGLSSGDTASVGVGGLTLGGGIGWMVRAWGLACDQLVGARLVTAAGEVLEVDAASYPELWWGLRGAGSTLGVVTRFDFRAHALPGVVFTTLGLSGDARPILAALRDLLADAPQELTVTYMDVPAMDPSAPAGATITALWAGDDEAASRTALAPLLALDGVSVTDAGVRRYRDILLDAPPFDPEQPMPGFIGGNALLRTLDDDTIDAVAAFRERNAASVLFLRSVGGAYGDVAADASAFPARAATWFVMAGAFDLPGLVDDASRPAIQASWDRIEAGAAGVYGNFTQAVDGSVAPKMFPEPARTRLAALKREWDPENMFSRSHSVRPA
ncbi:FAD-binding oxidoreductase [Microbacterium sp. CJ88]|uniref:FAD-binding oxidoreductase n=1 Tax=Microbacterium sp. CJ88 TaxID=3445672 RepID=UPI003F657564